MIKRIIAAVIVCLVGMTVNAQERGASIFADSFDAKGTFVENWNAKGKVANEDGVVTMTGVNQGMLTPKCAIPEEFYLTVKVTLLKPEDPEKRGYAGVIFGAQNKFLIRFDGGASTVHNLPGVERSQGVVRAIDGFEFGKANELTVIRKKHAQGVQYIYSVNGQGIGAVTLGNEQKTLPPILWSYRETAVFDDFQLFALKKEGEGSQNVAVNSSFEYLQEGSPTFFNIDQHASVRKFNYKRSYEEFLTLLAVDTAEKVDGKQSLKMVVNEVAPQQGFVTFNTGVIVGQPVTFSIYLKSDQNDLPVDMFILEMYGKTHKQKINLTREWKRYTFTISAAKQPTARLGMAFTTPGTVWADALQVEIGTTATAYKPSDLDAQKFTAATEQTAPLQLAVPKLKKIPTMDGNLDAWKDGAASTDKFYCKADPSTLSTTAYFGCDEDNFYVGVRAKVDDLTKIRAKPTESDSFAIFSNDNVEIFLDPGKSNVKYYQLVTSAANSHADIGVGRNQKWNGDWTSAVRINEAAKSIDYEIKIPFHQLATENITGDWGVNIGRFDAATGSVICLMPMPGTPNFHEVPRFPVFKLPAEVTSKYALGWTNTKITKLPDGKFRFIGELANRSGREIRGTVLAHAARDGALLGQEAVTLRPQDNEVGLVLEKYDAANTDVTLTLRNDSGVIFTQNRRPEMFEPVTIFSKYNYYMNEPEVEFMIETTLANPEKLTAVLKMGDKTVTAPASGRFVMKLPTAGLTDGSHEVTLDLQQAQSSVGVAKTVVTKKPFRQGATQIDYNRRCLVAGGKPILPFLPVVQIHYDSKDTDEVVDFWADNGFKQLMIVFNERAVDNAVKFLKHAQERDIKVVVWMVWHTIAGRTDAELGAIAARLEPWPNAIGQLILDEPELYWASDKSRDFVTRMRKFFPYQPSFMNSTVMGIPNRFADLNTDIVMLDDYLTNRENRTVKNIVDNVDMLWNAGKAERKPVFYFLAGNNLHNHYREPSGPEQYAQTYGSLAGGCTGFAYFLGMPAYPAHWKAFKELNKELLALNDVILSEEQTAPAILSDLRLRSITRRHNGNLYVIAVNVDPVASAVRITLPSGQRYAAEAEVEFEGRKVKVENGVLTDTFLGLSRHVYKIGIMKE